MLEIDEELFIPVRKLSSAAYEVRITSSIDSRTKYFIFRRPTLGLDINAQRNLRKFLKKYNKETNSTICLTSHYMKDITSLCKRVICVHNGAISYDGQLDLLLKSLSPFKEILIICRSEADAIQIGNSGFIVKNKANNEITIKVENNSITSSLKRILNNFDIEDLYINEPPIDEIIGKILIKKNYYI